MWAGPGWKEAERREGDRLGTTAFGWRDEREKSKRWR